MTIRGTAETVILTPDCHHIEASLRQAVRRFLVAETAHLLNWAVMLIKVALTTRRSVRPGQLPGGGPGGMGAGPGGGGWLWKLRVWDG
jgi:hypothetical protein